MSTKTMTATAGPKIKTALPGPNAKRVLEGDQKFISPSYTRSYPMVAKSGHGIVVTDVDGNDFFDFSAGIAVTSTGHCHPKVVAAIQKQAGELIHMSGTDFYYENMVQLAERLSKIAPRGEPCTRTANVLPSRHTWAFAGSEDCAPCRSSKESSFVEPTRLFASLTTPVSPVLPSTHVAAPTAAAPTCHELLSTTKSLLPTSVTPSEPIWSPVADPVRVLIVSAPLPPPPPTDT